MKKLLWAGALALPLLAWPAPANAFYVGNCKVDAGANVFFNVSPAYRPQTGPWYLYWPYEAHFQVPAPGVSPYFPPPQTLPPGYGQPPYPPMPPAQGFYRAPGPMPPAQGYYRPPVPVPPAGLQPAYYYP